MTTWFKTYWWIPVTLIIGGLLAWAYFYFRNPKNKITFGFKSVNDLASLLPAIEKRNASRSTDKGIGIYLDVPLTTIIKNKGAKELRLNNIAGTLSYGGESIFQTKANSNALKDVTVAGKTQKPITDTFQVLINGKTIEYIKEILKGNKPKLNYDLTAMILGDVYSFRDSSVLNESAPSGNPIHEPVH